MRKALFILILISVAGFAGVFLAFSRNVPPAPDTIFINDAVIIAIQSGDITDSTRFLTNQLKQAFSDLDASRQKRDRWLFVSMCLIIGAFMLSGVMLYIYCERGILKPFRKLQGFARHIAAGNLDIPLEMDKNNLFGAFTESFDLMREELHRARENERKTERSKKELVASLSHDIKTPVASIKAVTELMLVKTTDEKERKQLETVSAKAEQINALITNMFHATLEELKALSVNAAEIQSTVLPDLIKNADYENRVKLIPMPDCIISADLLRLQQIFDNIISNSYKYAGTEIEINSFIDGQELVMEIIDYGKGVSDDELPLLTSKFYRGKNTETKSGYGLGLYISNYFLEQMAGKMRCENRPDGFMVKVSLRLS